MADWRPLPIAHADSDSHSYIHADTDCNGDRHSYGYIHAYTNSNSYSHPHCNANCNSHGNSHPDTNTHGDIYPNANSHSYIYSNANGDSNRNTYGDCYGHSYGYRDAYGNPDINANTNGNSNGYTDANVNCHARRLCSRTRVLEESSRSNIVDGADGSAIAQTLADLDALIGNRIIPLVGNGYLRPRNVAFYVSTVSRYNEGMLCAPNCD